MRGDAYRMSLRIAGVALVVLILLFVLLPVGVVGVAAFNGKAVLSFPPQSWSLRWFERALAYRDFQTGLRAGLIVTAWSSTLAVVIGTAVVIAVHRHAFALRRALEAVLLSPLFIPHFTIGLGLLILVAQLEVGRGFAVVVFCHVVLVLPFVMRSVLVSLRNMDARVELAAASLGATPLRVLGTVTLPLMAPGLFGGWLFAAVMSFNEFTATLFVTTQATQTLPVAMYNYVREYADPTLAALSVIYIVVTAGGLVVADRMLGLGRVLNVDAGR